MEALQGGTACF